MINISSALAFYTTPAHRMANRPYIWSNRDLVPLMSETKQIPPFAIYRDTNIGGAITAATLTRIKDGVTFDVLADMQGKGLAFDAGVDNVTGDAYDMIYWPASQALADAGLTDEQYYFEVTDGTTTWYSELLQMCGDTSSLLKITFSHAENMDLPFGHLPYEVDGFKSWFYFHSIPKRPEYRYEEIVDNREGFQFPLQRVSYKVHKFEEHLPEHIIDILRLVRLHDCVTIDFCGITYNVDEFGMNIGDWMEQGHIARVDVDFRIDTVVVVNGRSVSASACATTVTVGLTECDISIEGYYRNENEASAGGVVNGDYYALTGDNDYGVEYEGMVVQLNPVVGYANDAAGQAGVGNETCYPMSLVNDMGQPQGLMKYTQVTSTTYTDDTAAGVGGVSASELYLFSNPGVNPGAHPWIKVMQGAVTAATPVITSLNVVVGACNVNKYSVTVTVGFTDPPSTGTLKVTVDGNIQQVSASSLAGTTSYVFSFPKVTSSGNGIRLVNAVFTTEVSTSTDTTYTDPNCGGASGWTSTGDTSTVGFSDCGSDALAVFGPSSSVKISFNTATDLTFVWTTNGTTAFTDGTRRIVLTHDINGIFGFHVIGDAVTNIYDNQAMTAITWTPC